MIQHRRAGNSHRLENIFYFFFLNKLATAFPGVDNIKCDTYKTYIMFFHVNYFWYNLLQKRLFLYFYFFMASV